MVIERSRNALFRSFPLFLSVFALISCTDFYKTHWYDHEYRVENRLDKVVFIDTRLKDDVKTNEAKERTFTVAPGERVTVHTEKHIKTEGVIPNDPYLIWSYAYPKVPNQCEKFDIYIDGVLMPDSLRQRKYWVRTFADPVIIYTLPITESRFPL
jgi:hypothetical protein